MEKVHLIVDELEVIRSADLNGIYQADMTNFHLALESNVGTLIEMIRKEND